MHIHNVLWYFNIAYVFINSLSCLTPHIYLFIICRTSTMKMKIQDFCEIFCEIAWSMSPFCLVGHIVLLNRSIFKIQNLFGMMISLYRTNSCLERVHLNVAHEWYLGRSLCHFAWRRQNYQAILDLIRTKSTRKNIPLTFQSALCLVMAIRWRGMYTYGDQVRNHYVYCEYVWWVKIANWLMHYTQYI